MPTINIAPKAMQNGDNVTVYKDTVGPQQQTYTFLTSQERVILKNSGSKNITYTVGSQSGSLGPSQSVEVKETITSINLTAEQGTQQFEIWADESGTKGISPEAVQSLGDQVSSFTTQLADKASQGALNSVKSNRTYVEDYPIISPEVDDTARITRAYNASLTSGKKLEFKAGYTYNITSASLSFTATDFEIIGNGATLNNTAYTTTSRILTITGSQNIIINNLKLSGVRYQITGSTNVLIDGCNVTKAFYNGINIDSSTNVQIKKTIINDIGYNPALNVSFEGCGIYITNASSNVTVKQCDISQTKGYGGVYLNGNLTNINVLDNDIYNIKYRGVMVWGGTNTTGEITNNRIKKTGYGLVTGSGVGCNGIYGSLNKMLVKNNNIQDVIENGIEGGFDEISGNTIINTGIDQTNYPTPSTEGIWGYKKILRNIIINPRGNGIKFYSTTQISDLLIEQNTVVKGSNTDTTKAGIDVNSDASYNNLNIIKNTSIDFIYCLYLKTRTYTNSKTTGNVATGSHLGIYQEYFVDDSLFGTARPARPEISRMFFDTTLNKPIWCKTRSIVDGSGNVTTPAVWVDSTGATV